LVTARVIGLVVSCTTLCDTGSGCGRSGSCSCACTCSAGGGGSRCTISRENPWPPHLVWLGVGGSNAIIPIDVVFFVGILVVVIQAEPPAGCFANGLDEVSSTRERKEVERLIVRVPVTRFNHGLWKRTIEQFGLTYCKTNLAVSIA